MPIDTNRLVSILRNIGHMYAFPNLELELGYLPFMNLTFSTSGEDLWLRQYMKAKLRSGIPGFYVDLGANDPVNTSTTFLFYCYGWSGICIDANERFREKFHQHRPRDIFIGAAVSDVASSLYFAEHKQALTMSQVRDDPATFGPDFHEPRKVPTLALVDILNSHVPEGRTIDFMSIDIEASELPALRSNDWSKYKPRVILIETGGHTFDPLQPCDFPTIAYLRLQGYQYQGYANNNVLMSLPS